MMEQLTHVPERKKEKNQQKHHEKFSNETEAIRVSGAPAELQQRRKREESD